MVPYSTWLVAGSLVVQVMVAPLVLMLPAATALITGGVVSAVMAKVRPVALPPPGVGLTTVKVGVPVVAR